MLCHWWSLHLGQPRTTIIWNLSDYWILRFFFFRSEPKYKKWGLLSSDSSWERINKTQRTKQTLRMKTSLRLLHSHFGACGDICYSNSTHVATLITQSIVQLSLEVRDACCNGVSSTSIFTSALMMWERISNWSKSNLSSPTVVGC